MTPFAWCKLSSFPVTEMQEYVVGFLFDPEFQVVALIEKKRPDWQAGRLNGIGGHIEKGETAVEAMEREFQEETGHLVHGWKWHAYCQMEQRPTADSPGALVQVFMAVGDLTELESPTDERVMLFRVESLPPNVLVNLRWLIPLALDHTVSYTECQFPDPRESYT